LTANRIEEKKVTMRDMPNLDFVRSVAVITVVLEHILLAFGFLQAGPYSMAYLGVLGVMVFFVLTSLVLMWSLERRPHTLDFYIRRWFRIYPLALAVIAVAFLFHAPTGGSPDAIFQYSDPSLHDLLMQSSLLQPADSLLVGVMWTLPYEVEMYLLLPVIFFFVRKNFSLWPLLVLWGLVLLNMRNVPSDMHNFGVAIGYFLPGVMAYVAYGRWKPKLPAYLLPVFLLAAWAIFLYHCDFHKAWWFCLLIALGLPLFRQIKSELVLAPSRVLARYSYSVYLTHPFALMVGLHLLQGHSLALRLTVSGLCLVVFPVAAYHLLEHPLNRIGSRFAARAEKRYEQSDVCNFRKQKAAE
jgi:peptidoglycan/LPS O-acetylase OafA/YrhL